MSGLRTVKRDFSSNSVGSSQTSNSTESSRQATLSTQEMRLKMIQDALNGVPAATDKKSPFSAPNRTHTAATNSRTAGLKRPSQDDIESSAKRRQLPSSWDKGQDRYSQSSSIASYSSTRALSASASVNSASTTTISISSTTRSSAKPAGVFLSQEQTHILKLVESGQSLFYTGSAGEVSV